jgi:hypothetical protein
MPAPSPVSDARRDAIAHFYGERADCLQRLVARRATAPPHVIEGLPSYPIRLPHVVRTTPNANRPA